MICVQTLGIEQPVDLKVPRGTQWRIHSDLDLLELGLQTADCQVSLVIIPLQASGYFNEVMFALRHKNKGVPVVICTAGRFPREITEDLLVFMDKCLRDQVPMKAEILFDEFALNLVDRQVLVQIIKHFETEML